MVFKTRACVWVNHIRTKLLGQSIQKLVLCVNLPEKVDYNVIYINYEEGCCAYLMMKCPCGCGKDIDLSLIPNLKPKWDIIFHWNGTISLNPSIRRIAGCKSHFYYKRGRVVWCQ